jgi:prevent-host-death family protein
MAADRAEGKTEEVELVSMDAARDGLTELVLRAGMRDERIVLTRNGKQTAAIIGLRDLERLREMDAA